MARIPGIQFATVNRDVVQPATISSSRAAQLAEAQNQVDDGGLQAAGQALGAASNVLNQIAERDAETKAQKLTSQFILDEQEAFQNLTLERQQNPENFTDDYLKSLESRYNNIVPKEASARLKNKLTQWYGVYKGKAAQDAIGYEASQKSKVQIDRMSVAHENMKALVQRDPSQLEYALQQSLQAIDRAQDSAIVPNPESLKLSVQNGLFTSGYEGLVSSGNLSGAKAYIENNKVGLGDNYLKVKDDLNRRIEAVQKERQDLARLQDVSNGKQFFDPYNTKDKKLINSIYGQTQIDTGIQSQDPFASQMALEMVNKYKIIPEDLQSTLRGMMTSGGEEQKTYAYNMVNELQNAGGVGFTDKEISDATTYNALIDVGYGDRQALETIEFYDSKDFEPLRKIRTDILSGKENPYKKENNVTQLKKLIDKVPGIPFIGQDDVPLEMAEDYVTIRDQEYIKTGNADAAKRKAASMLVDGPNPKYRVSEITKEQYTAYAPEFYSRLNLPPEETRKWQKKALKKDLKELDVSDNLKDYTLMPIYENKDLVTQGIPPVFYLMHDDGDFVRDKNNEILVYQFDDNVGAKYAQELEAKTDLKEKRKLRLRAFQADPDSNAFDKFLLERITDTQNLLTDLGL